MISHEDALFNALCDVQGITVKLLDALYYLFPKILDDIDVYYGYKHGYSVEEPSLLECEGKYTLVYTYEWFKELSLDIFVKIHSNHVAIYFVDKDVVAETVYVFFDKNNITLMTVDGRQKVYNANTD